MSETFGEKPQRLKDRARLAINLSVWSFSRRLMHALVERGVLKRDEAGKVLDEHIQDLDFFGEGFGLEDFLGPLALSAAVTKAEILGTPLPDNPETLFR